MRVLRSCLIPVLTIAVLSFFSVAAFAQTWQKTYGTTCTDRGRSIQQTDDGGFILAGFTDVSCGSGIYDMYMVKIDRSGNELWSSTYGGAEDEDAESVQQTDDGGFILAGDTESFGAGASDIYLVKTDETGKELWSKTFGGDDWEHGYSVEQTEDGGYIIAGVTYSYDIGRGDYYLIRTDENGNGVWSNTFGGAELDVAYEVHQTDDGGFIAVGFSASFGVGDDDDDAYLVKTDEDGNELWSKAFSYSYSGHSVQQTADGGYIIAGDIYRTFHWDHLLIKTDGDGNELWVKIYGGSDNDSAESIKQTPDGGYIFTGFSWIEQARKTDLVLVRTDAAGRKIWERNYGGYLWEEGYSVDVTDDGGYIAVGDTESFGHGCEDLYVVYYNPPGQCGAMPELTSPVHALLFLLPLFVFVILSKRILGRKA